MANNVTNIIELREKPERVQELLNTIGNDEYGSGSISFEKIIPMPGNLYMGAIQGMAHNLTVKMTGWTGAVQTGDPSGMPMDSTTGPKISLIIYCGFYCQSAFWSFSTCLKCSRMW